MAQLSLVKSLLQLKEEQRSTEEIVLETLQLAFTRGTVTEIAGGPSTGKTSLALTLLAKLTDAGEICAVVDAADGFDPNTAFLAGTRLENLLWVRCGGDIEKAFLSADYLVQAKGFGAIWLNLLGLSKRHLRMVPKTYWYRFRTRIKETPTLFIVTSSEPVTGTASHHALALSSESLVWKGSGNFKLLREFHIQINSKRDFWGHPIKASLQVDHSEI